MPIGVVWLVTVLAGWIVTTAVLAVMIGVAYPQTATGALVTQSMGSAAFACVVVGGPATAVALRVRRTASRGKALLSGLAVAALVMLFLYSYLEAYGTQVSGAWSALAPVFAVALAEMALAFTLRGRRLAAAAAPPAPAAPDNG